jgi:hypothetical protein
MWCDTIFTERQYAKPQQDYTPYVGRDSRNEVVMAEVLFASKVTLGPRR